MLFCCRMTLLEMLDSLKIHFPHYLSQYFKGELCLLHSVLLSDCLSVFLTRWRTGFLISPLGVIISIERLKLELNEFQSCLFGVLWRPVGMLIVT